MFTNPYPGINAHVNSMLQTPGTPEQPALWHSFHAAHIMAIANALNRRIRPRYVARGEQSIQVRGRDFGGQVETYRPLPDVTVFKRDGEAVVTSLATIEPRLRLRLADILEPIPQLRAVLIHEQLPLPKVGRVVARIELLSPSNKPGGSNYQAYSVKRTEALQTGVPLIEIDYLHESRSPVLQLERYPDDSDSYPYHVLVSDPRVQWGSGEVQDFSFHVGEPVTAFPLPLDKDERIIVDLNAVYQQTLDDGGWLDTLDYTQPPERFETYSAADQARILAVMQSVAKQD
ncbi:MAG: DUF4058 family protein [Chloroflexota bacterium]|nr:DUF4058 family protein [Chloroflexota bacterium]